MKVDYESPGWRQGERRQRRIIMVSIGIAVVAHLVFFLVAPRVQFSVTSDRIFGEAAMQRLVLGDLAVDLHFGPPRILLPDGSRVEEPPERFLEATNLALTVLEVNPVCADRFRPGLPPFEGEIRLRVGHEGRVTVMGLEAGTGDRCADAALVAAAESLWYRWLPDERHPAPVDLVQPLRVSATQSG
ncbi:MAG: hypothetical protein EA350_03125 [Gemmatimonadales bacterium]|nr:MAG: hypothetical protein EA350_03125 [Gemmatimonadales bacterium]